jgi:hypothetical protein
MQAKIHGVGQTLDAQLLRYGPDYWVRAVSTRGWPRGYASVGAKSGITLMCIFPVFSRLPAFLSQRYPERYLAIASRLYQFSTNPARPLRNALSGNAELVSRASQ